MDRDSRLQREVPTRERSLAGSSGAGPRRVLASADCRPAPRRPPGWRSCKTPRRSREARRLGRRLDRCAARAPPRPVRRRLFNRAGLAGTGSHGGRIWRASGPGLRVIRAPRAAEAHWHRQWAGGKQPTEGPAPSHQSLTRAARSPSCQCTGRCPAITMPRTSSGAIGSATQSQPLSPGAGFRRCSESQICATPPLCGALCGRPVVH
jgi:hypothetical protein